MESSYVLFYCDPLKDKVYVNDIYNFGHRLKGKHITSLLQR
jgi:hypothetical protein